jgi:hypothetical protein
VTYLELGTARCSFIEGVIPPKNGVIPISFTIVVNGVGDGWKRDGDNGNGENGWENSSRRHRKTTLLANTNESDSERITCVMITLLLL